MVVLGWVLKKLRVCKQEGRKRKYDQDNPPFVSSTICRLSIALTYLRFFWTAGQVNLWAGLKSWTGKHTLCDSGGASPQMPFRDPSYFTSLFVKNLETTSRDELSYWRLLVTYTVQKAFPVHMPTWRLIPVPARNYGMFRAKIKALPQQWRGAIDTHIPWGTQARSKYFSHCLVHPTGLSP
jgi:hypothetical protein